MRSARALRGAGCATVDTYFPTLRSFGVYKLDINQGNYLSQDMVDKLKVGQTKAQVRQLLGTPLVVSAFRDNRWDYVYEFTRQGGSVEHRKFTVYFVDDKLARWEGDEMPISVAELNQVGRGDHRRRGRRGPSRARGGSVPRHFQGNDRGGADRHRRRRRPDGPGADRGVARRSALSLAAALDVAGSPSSGATPASASAARPA